ncbi:hypothetical protein JCM8097_005826 [Rhodosporidiobolus ruineniae]
MSSSKRCHNDRDDDLPWWETERRSSHSSTSLTSSSRRGFDDHPPHRAGGGYYDRDRAPAHDGLPYDEPPRHSSHASGRDYRSGGGGRGYDRDRERERERDYRRDDRYGGGRRGSYDAGREYRRSREPEQRRDGQHRSPQPPPSQSAQPAPAAEEKKPAEETKEKKEDVEEGEVAQPDYDALLSSASAAEPDPEQILAERRRKRAEILAKYASASSASSTSASTPVGAVKEEEKAEGATPGREEVERSAKRLRIEGSDSPAVFTPTAPSTSASTSASLDPSRAPSVSASTSTEAADEPFTLEQDASTVAASASGEDVKGGEEEVSAADYNPDGADDDRERRERRVGELNGETEGVKQEEMILDGEEEEEEEDEDEDEDDEDDMFAIGTEKEKKPKKKKAGVKKAVPAVNRALPASSLASASASTLADNYDDPDGYYRTLLGESIGPSARYVVSATLGRGMFASVVRARDLGVDGRGRYEEEGEEGERGLKGKGVGEGKVREVAIKMVRSQESMYKAALKEAQILKRLRDADPDDRKHVVRLLRTFEHRGHYCMVFENMSMNLREVIKRYGKNVGLNLRAVRAYASQMFMALALLKKCEIMHADLKPDNILVNESKSTLKVCDLGSASDVSENEITPYLVSRFYRSPEIILGLPYDCSLDVWSIACTLYELYTGKILFPGRTNNHMLLLIMETKGKFNHKLIRKARFHDQHFDENMNFLYVEKNDTVTPRAIAANPPSSLRSRLMPPGVTRKLKDDEVRLLANFVDLLDKMLSLEPGRRPTPKELLNHPFIRG